MNDLMPVEAPPRPPNPLTILQTLAEKGGDAGQLEQIVNLHLKLKAADAEEQFNAAMVEVQIELPTIVKSKKSRNNTYAPLEEIQTLAKPVYTRHGFAFNFSEDDCPVPGHKRTVCDVVHRAGHSKRYHIDLANDGTGSKGEASGMNATQASVSTGSYGQRVLLARILNVTIADSDKDGAGFDDILKISEEQRLQVDQIIAQNKKLTPEGLCKWLKIESLDDMTVTKFRHFAQTYRQRAGGAA
jgi:hypothetical protein